MVPPSPSSLPPINPRVPPSPPAAPPPLPPSDPRGVLKTHKTGAGSVGFNVLHRFGEGRGLRFALPHHYQFRKIPRNLQGRKGEGLQRGGGPIRHHLPPHEVRRVMPPDSFYFSIARDPAAAAESALSYYRSSVPAFRRAPSRSAFLLTPWLYYQPGLKGNHYARNLLWFDFGLPSISPSNMAAVAAAVRGLDAIFALVLLAEYFDESLVLLADALCWPLGAVVTFPHNGRPKGSVLRLGRGDMERLRQWNALDWALYVHFNRSFWARVRRFGLARMEREVTRLRGLREQWAQRCLQGGGPLPAAAILDRNLKPFQPGQGAAAVMGYELRADLGARDRETCERMATPELQYKDRLHRRQFGPNATNG
uniref:Galactose-3-O-sulfotransferase 4 n=1 Tax=Coturnix japonica TaxID=93934 RepID=A0A8C2SRG3_COTJA